MTSIQSLLKWHLRSNLKKIGHNDLYKMLLRLPIKLKSEEDWARQPIRDVTQVAN